MTPSTRRPADTRGLTPVVGRLPHAGMGPGARSRCEPHTGEESWENNQPDHQAGRRAPKARPNRPHHQEDQMDQYDTHCKQHACRCDHRICYRGWIDTPPETTPPTTQPCPLCREDLTRRLARRERARAKGYPIEALHRLIDERDNAAA